MQFPIGKHKGTEISALPSHYLKWLVTEYDFKVTDPKFGAKNSVLKQEVEAEYRLRQSGEKQTQTIYPGQAQASQDRSTPLTAPQNTHLNAPGLATTKVQPLPYHDIARIADSLEKIANFLTDPLELSHLIAQMKDLEK